MLLAGGREDVTQAAAEFARLAARYDVLPAWLGLAMAHHKQGNAPEAAMALQNLLARHCVPEEPGFAVLAGRIAADARYDGFCGMTASGDMRASAAGRLLGAPLDMVALTRVEGLVTVDEHGLTGWASRPAAQAAPPSLTLLDATGIRRRIKFGRILPADDDAPLLSRYGFRVSNVQLQGLTAPFSLRGPDGAQIFGSPVDPAAVAAIVPVPASHRGAAINSLPALRPLAVIIPVYRGLAETKACVESLFAALPGKRSRIIVVDDATPEAALAAWLDQLAATRKIRLCRHAENLGFAAAVNTGLTAAGNRDVLLLNSDTLVPPGAIGILRKIAYREPNTGSVTPLSNEATILSYPSPRGGNAVPDLADTIRRNALAGQANGTKSLEIPTCIGFCTYLRHDCLKATGGFRAEIFAQGYGEENDWCIRARHLGFVHRAALGAYVAHIGGVSFGAAARGLTARNLKRLNLLYPGYHQMIMAHIAADPLRAARARIDALRLRTDQDSVLLISHSHGGGVARQVAVQMDALRQEGLRPLLLVTQFPADPEHTPYPWPALLTEGHPADYPNLAFSLPAQKSALLRLLRAARVRRVVLHHALGHHPDIRTLAAGLNVPQDIVIHDYASFCRRVNLLTRPDEAAPPHYCGEPAITGCIDCCSRDTEEIFEPLDVPDLLARSARELARADHVFAPSADAGKRITRHFPGVKPIITPWEDDSVPVRLKPPGTERRRKIMVVGGIGPSKGFDLLLDCARDAAERDLALEFIVAGASADDAKLLETGRIFVTGAYAEGEAQGLISGFKPDLAFLPSIWPETWCFALSEAWRAGLYTVTFDLGAQAARIKVTGRGTTLPLGLPVPRINDFLLHWTP